MFTRLCLEIQVTKRTLYSDHRPNQTPDVTGHRTSDAVHSPRSKDRFDHSTDVEFGPRLPNNQNSRHISSEDRRHTPLIPLRHANHGELSPASALRQHRERPPSFSRSAHDRVSNQSSQRHQRSRSRSCDRCRSRSKSHSRDHGRLSRRDRHHVKKVSHKRKRSSSYSSYSSSLSSSSSSRERRKKKKSKRRHKSHRGGRKDYKKKNTRKRPRTPSPSSSSRSSSSSSAHSVEEERGSRVSHTRRELSQHRDRHSPELSVEIRSDECHLSERLGIFIGPYRCVSACPDSQAVTQVPSLLSERSDLPVQGFSIRAFDQPFRLYLPHECNCYISQEKSDHSASLSRRLVSQKPMSSNSVGTQTLSNVFDNFSRLDYQLREVRAHSNTDFHIHRDGILDQSQPCQSSLGQNSKNTPSHSGLFSGDIRISQDFPVSFGTTQCGSRSRCFGQTPSQTITNVPVVTMETSYTSIGPTDPSHSGCIISPQLVETRTDLPPRCAPESSPGLSHDLHGHQHGRLGTSRGTGGSVVSWCLDQRPIPSPHQHAGDAGNSSHSGSCLPCHNGLHGSGFNRQHHSSGISVSPGRHSFSRSQQRDLEDSNLVPTEQDPLTCEAYSRQVQHPGRPAKPGEQTYFDRVGSEPGNSQSSFFHDRVSKHRLVRNSSKPQASSVCFPNSRPEGTFNRCSINELEQSSCLCIFHRSISFKL